jgi:ABC-2 type transport system ATP-binding protein
MLALVARLGSFGISVLMATHLLDDVQRVCDHVVMISGGKLVVEGATESLLERTGTVTIDVGAHAEQLAAALNDAGLPSTVNDRSVDTTLATDDQMDVIRDLVAELGLPLYRLTTRSTSLDEVFLSRAGAQP